MILEVVYFLFEIKDLTIRVVVAVFDRGVLRVAARLGKPAFIALRAVYLIQYGDVIATVGGRHIRRAVVAFRGASDGPHVERFDVDNLESFFVADDLRHVVTRSEEHTSELQSH